MESPGALRKARETNYDNMRAAQDIHLTLTDERALWTTVEEQREKDALATLARLRFIQFSLCFLMLGWYSRMAATSLNSFYPKAFHFDDEEEYEAFLCAAIIIPTVTVFFMAVDFLYYHVLTQRDLWDFNQKQKEYKYAKLEKQDALKPKIDKQQHDRLTAAASEDILTEVINETQANLNQKKMEVIRILEEDIFIQQLLIQCEIHREDLIDAYREAGAQANIIELMRQFSENVSLKDYKNSHEQYQNKSRCIEYLQGLKIPRRFSSIILLSRTMGFDSYPNMFGTDDIAPYLQWILLGGFVLWCINSYTYYLEYKKNDTNTEYDKDIRKIRSAHHNALFATLLLSLNKKLNKEQTIIRAPQTQTEELFFGFTFSNIIWLKIITSLICLGPLARSPLTLFAFSGAENTVTAQIVVCVFVFVGILLDFYYSKLSLTQESWELKNQSDKEFVLKNCKEVENTEGNTMPKDFLTYSEEKELLKKCRFTRTERKLYKELKYNDTVGNTPSFRDENKKLSLFKDIIDRSHPVKYGLRALALGFCIPKLFGWHPDSVGKLPGDDAVMIFAALIAAVIGFMIQVMNREKENRVKPSAQDAKHQVEYTQNMILFFRDPVTATAGSPPKPRHWKHNVQQML